MWQHVVNYLTTVQAVEEVKSQRCPLLVAVVVNAFEGLRNRLTVDLLGVVSNLAQKLREPFAEVKVQLRWHHLNDLRE